MNDPDASTNSSDHPSHPSRVTKFNPKGLIRPAHAPLWQLFRRRPLESTEVLATRILRETEQAHPKPD